MSLPEFGRPPSRIDCPDRRRLPSPQSYSPPGTVLNAIRPPPPEPPRSSDAECASCPKSGTAYTTVCARGGTTSYPDGTRIEKPATSCVSPPVLANCLRRFACDRPPVPANTLSGASPNALGPQNAPYYRPDESTLTLSQVGRISDQRLRRHHQVPFPHDPNRLPVSRPPVSPSPQPPHPTHHHLHVPPYAQPVYKAPPVIQKPTAVDMSHSDLPQIDQERARPPNPTFPDLLGETRPFDKHPAPGGWHPCLPPSPIGTALQSGKPPAQRAKDEQTDRSGVRRSYIPNPNKKGDELKLLVRKVYNAAQVLLSCLFSLLAVGVIMTAFPFGNDQIGGSPLGHGVQV